ncbi:hypothetical protein SKAU_G00370860 [Synaphobranchus kaupii]|uniref:Uncharacterized protein n=1 Tax=Synaphobranchus kaupii TaxID=118154 RepID=A0A9Q1EG11_SYNKA|nr:hypothetical protein SKAU_G00370860 [Synaphobranchus kaupii]
MRAARERPDWVRHRQEHLVTKNGRISTAFPPPWPQPGKTRNKNKHADLAANAHTRPARLDTTQLPSRFTGLKRVWGSRNRLGILTQQKESTPERERERVGGKEGERETTKEEEEEDVPKSRKMLHNKEKQWPKRRFKKVFLQNGIQRKSVLGSNGDSSTNGKVPTPEATGDSPLPLRAERPYLGRSDGGVRRMKPDSDPSLPARKGGRRRDRESHFIPQLSTRSIQRPGTLIPPLLHSICTPCPSARGREGGLAVGGLAAATANAAVLLLLHLRLGDRSAQFGGEFYGGLSLCLSVNE